MPRPNSIVKEAPDMDELPMENESVDSTESNGDESAPRKRRQYQRREVSIPEGVSTGYGELVAEEPPTVKRKGGRGRGPSPVIPQLVQKIKEQPDTWFYIGNFKSTSSPDGLWKENGIKFKHAPFMDADGNAVEGLYKRYAKFPGANDTDNGDDE